MMAHHSMRGITSTDTTIQQTLWLPSLPYHIQCVYNIRSFSKRNGNEAMAKQEPAHSSNRQQCSASRCMSTRYAHRCVVYTRRFTHALADWIYSRVIHVESVLYSCYPRARHRYYSLKTEHTKEKMCNTYTGWFMYAFKNVILKPSDTLLLLVS